MAHQLPPHGDRPTTYLSTHYPSTSNGDEYKSSYDDLIDQYAEPYSRISGHQTYEVHTNPIPDPPSRGTSYSLDKASPYISDKAPATSADSSEPPTPGYPPRQKQEKVVDNRNFFAKARRASCQVFFCYLTALQILPDSWACRLFVLTVVIETTIDLAIEGDLFVRLKDSDKADSESTKKMPVYLSIFALAQ